MARRVLYRNRMETRRRAKAVKVKRATKIWCTKCGLRRSTTCRCGKRGRIPMDVRTANAIHAACAALPDRGAAMRALAACMLVELNAPEACEVIVQIANEARKSERSPDD